MAELLKRIEALEKEVTELKKQVQPKELSIKIADQVIQSLKKCGTIP